MQGAARGSVMLLWEWQPTHQTFIQSPHRKLVTSTFTENLPISKC